LKKVKVYGSKHCPDCQPVLDTLDAHGIDYEYADITEGMWQVREFLILRETRPEFDRIREMGAIGMPCIVVNDGEAVLFQDFNIEQLVALVQNDDK
jgi:glutaredoxin-related protein